MDRAAGLIGGEAMARHRSFSFEFKRQVVLDFLEGRAELRGLARQHSLSRHLIRLWIQKYEAGQLNDEVADATRIAEYETTIASSSARSAS